MSTGAYIHQVFSVPSGVLVEDSAKIEKITWATWTRWDRYRMFCSYGGFYIPRLFVPLDAHKNLSLCSIVHTVTLIISIAELLYYLAFHLLICQQFVSMLSLYFCMSHVLFFAICASVGAFKLSSYPKVINLLFSIW